MGSKIALSIIFGCLFGFVLFMSWAVYKDNQYDDICKAAGYDRGVFKIPKKHRTCINYYPVPEPKETE